MIEKRDSLIGNSPNNENIFIVWRDNGNIRSFNCNASWKAFQDMRDAIHECLIQTNDMEDYHVPKIDIFSLPNGVTIPKDGSFDKDEILEELIFIEIIDIKDMSITELKKLCAVKNSFTLNGD